MGVFGDSWAIDAMAIFVILLTSIYLYFKRQYAYWDRKGIKTLPGLNYLAGHFGALYLQKESIADLSVRLYRSSNEPYEGMYGFLRRILMIRDPELIRKILIKDFDYFTDRGNEINEDYDPLTGNLVNLPGHKWRSVRRELTPTFASGKLKAMFPTLLECGSSLESYLAKVADNGGILDVVDISARHGTNVIASIFFGIEIDCVVDPDNDFRKYGSRIFATTTWNAFKRLSRFVAPQVIRFFRIKFADPGVENFIHSLVKENLEYRERYNIIRKDFFQLLIQLRNTGNVQKDDEWETVIKNDGSQKKMSLDEIKAHSFAFFGAGFETSSTTMSFCMYELAKNPDIQERVRNEIKTVLAQHNEQITYESVSEMKYLGYCIDETLRMYNVFPTVARKCVKDYQIPDTDKIIEKGDLIIFPSFAAHRDEKYYPNPENFDPERFNEQNSAGKNQINRPYLPFGDGPRNCIGLRLGKMQVQVGLVIMLQKFKYELTDSLKNRKMEFAIKGTNVAPRDAIQLNVSKIQKSL
ncbi:probable cytochrome P450 6d4 [Contarinia nasturtii]|uniref:probable cytochrome P450 6d4 n=1 Tax=Contarinia nasturtii TaxID=265458 RepID=UPI0012D3FA57|nr:probable cytochrome P450 6d4 [Contarinia nasturtii]